MRFGLVASDISGADSVAGHPPARWHILPAIFVALVMVLPKYPAYRCKNHLMTM